MVYTLRSHVCESTGFTPAELMFGRNLNDPFAVEFRKLRSATKNDIKEYYKSILNNHEFIFKTTRDQMALTRQNNRSYYDVTRIDVQFNVGELVLYKLHPLSIASRGIAASLSKKREGPYRIIEKESKTIYRIGDTMSGAPYTRAHVSQLRRFHSRQETDLPKAPRIGRLSSAAKKSA
jgi:hypothetical protein